MSEYIIIRNKEDKEDFISDLTDYDRDFDPDLPNIFPYYVFYSKEESNGYPTVTYEVFSIDCLERMLERLKDR